MRRIILLLLLILFFVLDNTCIPFFSIYGYYPSLLFSFTICYSILNEKGDAVEIGVISGLLQDLYFFHGFGVNALINMFLCLFASHIGISIFKEKLFIPVITSFLLSFLKGVLVFCILYALNVHVPMNGILFNSLYTMLIAIFMYKWTYKFCNKPYMRKKWKF